MTTENVSPESSTTPAGDGTSSSSSCRGHRRSSHGGRFFRMLTLFLALGGTIALVKFAFAGDGGFGGFGKCHRGGEVTLEEAQSHASKGAKWILREVDADDAQTEAASAIVASAVEDLYGMKAEKEALKDAFTDALTADVVDRNQLHTLRQQGLVQAEQASRRVVDAVADLANVLTPAQRVELAEKLEKFHR